MIWELHQCSSITAKGREGPKISHSALEATLINEMLGPQLQGLDSSKASGPFLDLFIYCQMFNSKLGGSSGGR